MQDRTVETLMTEMSDVKERNEIIKIKKQF